MAKTARRPGRRLLEQKAKWDFLFRRGLTPFRELRKWEILRVLWLMVVPTMPAHWPAPSRELRGSSARPVRSFYSPERSRLTLRSHFLSYLGNGRR